MKAFQERFSEITKLYWSAAQWVGCTDFDDEKINKQFTGNSSVVGRRSTAPSCATYQQCSIREMLHELPTGVKAIWGRED